MSDVFISYAAQDSAVASRLADSLHENGISVYSDDQTLVMGAKWQDRIPNEIRNAKTVLVLLSEHSKRSEWVEKELQTALDNSNFVIPILLDSSAKENRVWPLLADRQAIVHSPNTDFKEVVDRITEVVSDKAAVPEEKTLRPESLALPVKSERRAGLTWLVPFLTGILGAFLAWLFLR